MSAGGRKVRKTEAEKTDKNIEENTLRGQISGIYFKITGILARGLSCRPHLQQYSTRHRRAGIACSYIAGCTWSENGRYTVLQ